MIAAPVFSLRRVIAVVALAFATAWSLGYWTHPAAGARTCAAPCTQGAQP